MTAQVADEVGDDLTVGEAPAAVDALEAIVVAPGDDRLEREVGAGLQHGEIRTRRRGRTVTADLDRDVADHMLRARSAVVEDHAVVAPPHLFRSPQRSTAPGGAPRGVGEERGQAVEITAV